jgi:hypothetical protein
MKIGLKRRPIGIGWIEDDQPVSPHPGRARIVWDLETVPDLGGFAAANDLVGKPDAGVREAIGDKFPKHSIVCIGALI